MPLKLIRPSSGSRYVSKRFYRESFDREFLQSDFKTALSPTVATMRRQGAGRGCHPLPGWLAPGLEKPLAAGLPGDVRKQDCGDHAEGENHDPGTASAYSGSSRSAMISRNRSWPDTPPTSSGGRALSPATQVPCLGVALSIKNFSIAMDPLIPAEAETISASAFIPPATQLPKPVRIVSASAALSCGRRTPPLDRIAYASLAIFSR